MLMMTISNFKVNLRHVLYGADFSDFPYVVITRYDFKLLVLLLSGMMSLIFWFVLTCCSSIFGAVLSSSFLFCPLLSIVCRMLCMYV